MDGEFETRNLDLATFLMSNETNTMKVLRVAKDPENPKISIFYFEDCPERDQLTLNFLAGRDDYVSASKFAAAQRQLKSWLHLNSR